MTNDDIRRIAAEVKRELHADVRIVIDGLHRVEQTLDLISRRVGHLENDKIAREAREDERSKAAKEAAELVATKAADAITEKQWSVKKWTAIATAVTGGIVAITALTGLLAQYVYHAS